MAPRLTRCFCFRAPSLFAAMFALLHWSVLAQMQTVHNEAATVAATLPPAGRPAAGQHLQLAICLPLRNQTALSQLLTQIGDPASPNYRHYLTAGQFAARFGPNEADYQAVVAFASTHHLTVTAKHPNRLVLDVDGAVPDIEQAFHVTMRTYRHPTEPRLFFAPDRDPTLDLAVPISHIGGLDDYNLPLASPTALKPAGKRPLALDGSGPDGLYLSGDIRADYVPNSQLNGSGQTAALVEFDGFSLTDVEMYCNQASIGYPAVTRVLLDGFDGTPSSFGGQSEATLDIDMLVAMAPGLSGITVYEAGPKGNWEDVLNRIATDDTASVISCSWFNRSAGDPAFNGIFAEMAAQGQSFFCAAGDDDAFTGPVRFPVDSPFVTVVGGTRLSQGEYGGYGSEKVWNGSGGIGSGGGVSTTQPIPSWQQDVDMKACGGSATRRDFPDVAMLADQVFAEVRSKEFAFRGTSCAAPLWAGFMALVNEEAASVGEPPVGFANPAIYAIGSGSRYRSDFNDITSGDNFSPRSPGRFRAATGYDLCTGWGSPAGTGLIDDLAGAGEQLEVSLAPANGKGAQGGPFYQPSNTYTVNNLGAALVSWTAVASEPWLTLSATSGSLTGNAFTTISATINAAAATLRRGTYTAVITFSDAVSGAIQTRQVQLQVSTPQPILAVAPGTGFLFSGYDGKAFSRSTAACQLTNAGDGPMNWKVSAKSRWLSITPASGTIPAGSSATVTLNLTADAQKVHAGTWQDTVSFTNLSNHEGDTTLPALLIVHTDPGPPVITSGTAASATAGSPFAYLIQASNGPYSYGATDLPAGLSLDSRTGLISGTIAGTGTDYFSISAVNVSGTGEATVCVETNPALSAPATGCYFFASANSGVSGNNPAVYLPSQGATITEEPWGTGQILFEVSGTDGSYWDAFLGSPTGDTFTPGTYSNVNALDLLLVSSQYILKEQLSLTLIIEDATYAQDGTLTSFAGEFVQTIYGSSWVAGSIRYNSSIPLIGIGPPAVANTTAIGFTGTSELIDDTVNTYGQNATYHIQYGTTPQEHEMTRPRDLQGGAPLPVPESDQLTGLSPDTEYYYKVVVSSTAGTFATPDAVFTTLPSTPLAPVITSATSVAASNDQSFSYQITASNNPLSYAAIVPAGCTFDASTGVVTGTFSTVGSTQMSVYAFNGAGTGSAVVNIQTLPPPPIITSTLSAAASVQSGFYYQIQGTYNPISYAASDLPDGLSFDSTTGLITGTATQTGTTDVTVMATNAIGTGSANLIVTIDSTPPPNTIFYFNSAPAAVGSGSSGFFMQDEGSSFVATQYDDRADFNITSTGTSNYNWWLSLVSADGDPLATGTYGDCVSAPGGNLISGFGPGLSFNSSYHSEASLTGTFTVLDVQFDSNHVVDSFAADFVQFDGGDPTLWNIGSIRFNSAVPVSVFPSGPGSLAAPAAGPESFDRWRAANFSALQLADAGQSGETASPAGDGIPNLVKYALHLKPGANGSSGMPVPSVVTLDGTRYLALTYTGLRAATDVAYIPEISSDMRSWHSGPAYLAVVRISTDPGGITEQITVRDAKPIGASAQQYIRLRIVRK